jgi:serine/threonine-protein kinase
VGEYTVRRRIGAGGMGIVYECVHPIIGKRAAVKVLKPEIAEDPDLMERLLSEARAVASIQHRSVIDIFGFGRLQDGRHYMVMEYLDGEPLDFLLHRVGRLPLAEAMDIFDAILSGLGAAHAVGVIHRDLKPSNVILVPQPDGSREVKVLDFGLAKQARPNEVTPQTVAGRVLGTPEYMAPEQARGLAIGPRTDLYAAGVLAYELVLGQVPFSGAGPVEVMFRHIHDPPPRPSALDPSLPPVFDELIARLLAKDAAERPASAEEVRSWVARIRNPVPTAKIRPPRTQANVEGRRLSVPAPPTPRGEERTVPAAQAIPEGDSSAPATDATLRELPQVGARAEPAAHVASEPTVPADPAARPTEVAVRAPRSWGPLIGVGALGAVLAGVVLWTAWPSSPVREVAPKPPPALSVDPAHAKAERAVGNLPPEAALPPALAVPSPPVKGAPVEATAPVAMQQPAFDAGPQAPVTEVTASPIDPTPAKADPFSHKALMARVRNLERRLGPAADPVAGAFLNDLKAGLMNKPSLAERRRIAGELDEWESRFLQSR